MQAKIDQNYRRSLLAVLDDGSFTTQPVLANPITKRLLVSAVVTSNNTGIGNTIPGGTPGSVLFLDVGSTLAEDNPNFFYNPSTVSFGIGTNTPNATLTVDGSVHFDLGGDATGDIFYRDAGGFLAPLGIGTAGQILTVAGGLPSWQTPGTGSAGYTTIQDNGTPLTQRSTMNFVNYFDITDVASVTTININTAQLGADTTLISTLETNLDLANISGQINLATQVTGQLSATNIDITNLESTLDLGNISGQIDLTTQVTGLLDASNIDESSLDLANIGGLLDLTSQVTGELPLANGGTGENLSDPGYDAVMVWDDTTNAVRFANLSGLSYDSGSNTLTSNGSGGGLFSSGSTNRLGINITDADPSLAYVKPMKFGNDLVVLTRVTKNSGNFKVRVYSRNSDGGYTETVIADIPTSNGIGTGVMSVSISKELDNSKLYVSKVSRSAGGGVQPVPMDIAIDEYDSSYSLVTTYTGQTLNSLFNSDVSSGFFVNGSSVYISLDNFRPGTVPKHWNRWTISGASLTSVTDTNLVKGDDSPAFSDGTNAWFSEGGSVSHFTYSGISFTFIGTSNFPTSTIGVNLTTSTSTDSYQGVEIVSSGTKIGWFINVSRPLGSDTDYMYEYNIYDF